jgi:hypothetical protein
LLRPGKRDLQQLENAPLGGSEPIEDDPLGGVGQAEALERGEDAAGGGRARASLGQEPGQLLVIELSAQLALDQAEDEQRQPDDADQRLDAVIVVEEDRPHSQRLLAVAVALLDPPLLLVQAKHAASPEPAREVGGERGEPAGERGLLERRLVPSPAEHGKGFRPGRSGNPGGRPQSLAKGNRGFGRGGRDGARSALVGHRPGPDAPGLGPARSLACCWPLAAGAKPLPTLRSRSLTRSTWPTWSRRPRSLERPSFGLPRAIRTPPSQLRSGGRAPLGAHLIA